MRKSKSNDTVKTITTLADLSHDPKNARRHTPRNVGMIEAALGEVGAARSIVIDEQGVVLAGNATIDAAARAGIERVQVVDGDGETIIAVRRTGLTAAQKARLALYDNRAAELAEWDAEVLAGLVAEDDKILAGMFERDELAEIMAEIEQPEPPDDPGAQIDRAEELRVKWQTATGDLWVLGEHRLVCGDCTDAAVVERVMGGERAGAVVTDPPYGVGVSYSKFDDTLDNVRNLIERAMPIIMQNLPAALTPGVPAMWDYPRPSWVGAWVHPAPTSSGAWGFIGANPILYYGKDPYLSIGKGRRDSSIVMVSDRKDENDHPVSKPLRVWEWLIERMTAAVGAIVLDPFAGSGTTGIACERLGRKARMVEIDPGYCAVILERWATMTGRTPERIGGA